MNDVIRNAQRPLRRRSTPSLGFALIEMLVAAGIMMVVALGMASLITNNQKEVTRIGARLETFSVTDEIRAILSNPANCSATFQGLGPNAVLGATAGSPFGIDSGGTAKFRTQQTFGNSFIAIESYSLSNAVPGLASDEIELRIKFNKPNVEGFQFTRAINLRLTNPALPVDATTNPCIAASSSTPTAVTTFDRAELCTTTLGGSWNSTTQKCNVPARIKSDNSVEICNIDNRGLMKTATISRSDLLQPIYVCDGKNWRRLSTTPACGNWGGTPGGTFQSDGWDETNGGIPQIHCTAPY